MIEIPHLTYEQRLIFAALILLVIIVILVRSYLYFRHRLEMDKWIDDDWTKR